MSLSNSEYPGWPSLQGVGAQFEYYVGLTSDTMFHGDRESRLDTFAGENDLDSYFSQFHRPQFMDQPYPEINANVNNSEEATDSLYDEQDSNIDYDDCSTCTDEEDIVMSDATDESSGDEFDLIDVEDIDTRLKSTGNLSIRDPSPLNDLKLW